MNNEEKELIRRIRNDCLKLKRQGQLTDFGEGQLTLCKLLLTMQKEEGLSPCIGSSHRTNRRQQVAKSAPKIHERSGRFSEKWRKSVIVAN